MDEIAKQFAQLAQQYGPSVIDAAKSAARIEAFSYLVSSAIPFGFAVMLWVATKCCFRAQPSWDRSDDWFLPPRFIGCVCAAISIICVAIGAWDWLDPWTWVTISHPELWIAHRALHL